MKAFLVCVAVALGAASIGIASDGAPLPIEAAIAEVRANAPQARGATERVTAAHGALYQAGRLPNPQLLLREENLTIRDEGPNRPTIDFFATVSQLVELGGKRTARQAIAAAELDVAQAERRQVERELILSTVERYVQALHARELVSLLRAARDGLDDVVRTMKRRVAEGYAAEADLLKFRAEAARWDTEVAQAQLEFARGAAALGALLGEPRPIADNRFVVPSPLPPPDGNREELIQGIVGRQPELRVAQARLERARQALALARAQRIPDPAFTAGYKRTQSTDTVVTEVLVPIPVFDTNAGNVQRAASEERAAAFELEFLQRKLQADAETLLDSAASLSARAQRVETEVLAPATVVQKAAHSAFLEGGANLLQLVDADRVYTDARRSALELKLQAYVAAYAARLACEESPAP